LSVTDVAEQIVDFDRSTLLRFLAQCVQELTILNRSKYDAENVALLLLRGNEAIHRLIGQLRDLIDVNVSLTDSRVAVMVEQIELLSPTAIERVLATVRPN
jgi:hypothetical protein